MPENADPTLQPGESLRLERERAGLSCIEVAERLNLTAAQIEMLEAENYGALAGPAYVQGYLRAYARLLGLDGTALVEAYRLQQQLGSLHHAEAARRRPNLDRGGSHRHWGLAVLMVVLAGLWGWQHWSGSDSAQPAPAPVLPEVAAPALMESPGQPVPEAEPAPRPTPRETRDSPGSPADDPVPLTLLPEALPAAGEAPAAQATDRPAPVVSADRLTLRFSDNCWIEVHDDTGDRLAVGVKRANEVLELTGDAPFRVLLGFAPAVEMDLNGRPVPVRADDSKQTAMLVVGGNSTGQAGNG